MYKVFNNFFEYLRTYARRIVDVFTIPPIPDFDKEIKDTWIDLNTNPNKQHKQEEYIPFDEIILEIIITFKEESKYLDSNIFLRFNSFGITSHSIKAFNFYTNFDKCELNNYIKIIKDAGFPIGTIGISRKAFSVDKCLISNCYGLYILKSSVPDEIYKKFCDNVSILAKKGYSSMVNIINKYTKKELLLNNN